MFHEINSESSPFPEIIPEVGCDIAIDIARGIHYPPTDNDLLAIATLNHHGIRADHAPDCPSRKPFSGVLTPSSLPDQIMGIEPGSTKPIEEGNPPPE